MLHKHHQRKYVTFNYPGAESGDKTLLTGIRGNLISGFFESNDGTTSFVHNGRFHNLNHPQQNSVTNLYGPNQIKNCKTIQVVGNYNIGSGNAIGCLYEGLVDGSGDWQDIIPTNVGNVKDVICHSIMGGLIVGNLNTIEDPTPSKAFIYDLKHHATYSITYPDAISITAYGIWHNCEDSYTICGGLELSNNKKFAYVVDWNNDTKTFHHWQLYNYNNDPVKALETHFNGITGAKNGYHLTGDWFGVGEEFKAGFFAVVKRNKHGGFKKNAIWTPVSYPNSKLTSGNSVYQDIVIGVYTDFVDDSVNGFISFLK